MPNSPTGSAVLPQWLTRNGDGALWIKLLSGLYKSEHVPEAAGCDGLEGDLCGSSVDFHNSFYQFRKLWLGSIFGIDFPMTAREWEVREVFNENLANSSPVKLPRLRAVFGLDPDDHRHPRHRSTQCSCFVGNLNLIGVGPSTTQDGLDWCCGDRSKGNNWNDKTRAVRPKLGRVVRLHLALKRGQASAFVMQVLVGHIVSVFQFLRGGLRFQTGIGNQVMKVR